MRPRTLRRIIIDLTPLIDVVTILLFGVMINSVAKTEAETNAARISVEEAQRQSQLDQDAVARLAAEREQLARTVSDLEAQLAGTKRTLSDAEAGRNELAQRLQRERASLAEAIANLLQMDDAERLTFRRQLEKISGATAQQLKAAVDDVRKQQDPVKVYKAVRRIEEMQKVFTFIDLHVDNQDFLAIVADARRLGREAVRGRLAADIERVMRQTLETVSFSPMVLILFSYEGEARDLVVEQTELAVQSLLQGYRTSVAGQGRQFRYGRVGLVSAPPNGAAPQ